MNVDDDNSNQRSVQAQAKGGSGMKAAGRSGSHSRSAANGGRKASGVATDKAAQRRGGQHNHGGNR